jgi:hypothetical protein
MTPPYDEGRGTYENVVGLPNAAAGQKPTKLEPTPPGKLHGAAIAGMAISAVVGIVALLARITVGWPGESDRYVMAIFIFAGIGFLASASVAVFSAARQTYPQRIGPEKEE